MSSSPKKRVANSPKRAPKRSRITKLIPTVVGAIADAENIAADLRTLMKHALPVVLNLDKADRGSFETEVVDQAQKSLGEILSTLEQKHSEAVSVQDAMIAPSEHDGRIKKKADADAALEAAKLKHEACRETRNGCHKAVNETHVAYKTAEKDAAAADREVQHITSQKAALTSLLETDFVLLRDNSSAGAQGKKAVQQVLSLGKKYSWDSTLLQTFPMTCKKPAASRSDFEQHFFTSLQGCIEGQINDFAQKLSESEAAKAEKVAAVATAKGTLDSAEADLASASEAVNAAHSAQKDAAKDVSKAEHSLQEIWNDMKKVCDAQDEVATEVAHFRDSILSAFQQLKEKEPEPEPVEEAPLDPTAEAAPAPAAESAPEAAPAATE